MGVESQPIISYYDYFQSSMMDTPVAYCRVPPLEIDFSPDCHVTPFHVMVRGFSPHLLDEPLEYLVIRSLGLLSLVLSRLFASHYSGKGRSPSADLPLLSGHRPFLVSGPS